MGLDVADGHIAKSAKAGDLAITADIPLSRADPVAVVHSEGLAHGFLALHSLEGTALADGDLIQTSSGNRVTTRLRFRFKDGSTHDETTVYTQRKSFRLVSDHVVQRGPAFKMAIESTVSASGEVKVRYTEDGKEKVIEDRLELPDDLANGLILTLLKNISPERPPASHRHVDPDRECQRQLLGEDALAGRRVSAPQDQGGGAPFTRPAAGEDHRIRARPSTGGSCRR